VRECHPSSFEDLSVPSQRRPSRRRGGFEWRRRAGFASGGCQRTAERRSNRKRRPKLRPEPDVKRSESEQSRQCALEKPVADFPAVCAMIDVKRWVLLNDGRTRAEYRSSNSQRDKTALCRAILISVRDFLPTPLRAHWSVPYGVHDLYKHALINSNGCNAVAAIESGGQQASVFASLCWSRVASKRRRPAPVVERRTHRTAMMAGKVGEDPQRRVSRQLRRDLRPTSGVHKEGEAGGAV